MMQRYQRSDGRWVAAAWHPTKRRFRTELTTTGLPSEADSIDDLRYARNYVSLSSLNRAINKRKEGKL